MGLKANSATALAARAEEMREAYDGQRGRNLNIDMTRGKPAPEQLDLSESLLAEMSADDCRGEDGTDYRNYGILDGIPEAKHLFAEYMEVSLCEIIVGGSGSLPMMYDALAGGALFGMPGGEAPWKDQAPIRFLCPVPAMTGILPSANV